MKDTSKVKISLEEVESEKNRLRTLNAIDASYRDASKIPDDAITAAEYAVFAKIPYSTAKARLYAMLKIGSVERVGLFYRNRTRVTFYRFVKAPPFRAPGRPAG